MSRHLDHIMTWLDFHRRTGIALGHPSPALCKPNFPKRPTNNTTMRTFAWERHDELISKCSYLAHDLQTHATRAEARIAKQDKRDTSGEHHASIVKKWIFLQGLNRMAQETENLCAWELRARIADRTHSPFDAELAIHSRYAWALDMGGQVWVSPLRALAQLEKALELALVRVLEI